MGKYDQRKKFEEWITFPGKTGITERDKSGDYVDPNTQVAWCAWMQGATGAMEQTAAEDERISKMIYKDCFSGDEELDHGKADDILTETLHELGYTKTVMAYEQVEKFFA